ncbi:hypothetical protein ACFQ1S_15335, partial [Kibdelosporangium lantanae]
MSAVEQELRRFGRRFVGLWRTVVLVAVAGIAFVRSGDEWPVVLGIGVAATVARRRSATMVRSDG